MIVTAQRVRRADREGINAFVYEDGRELPMGTTRDALLTVEPGRLLHQALEVPPGGNSVMSYLDVALPDAIRVGDAGWFFDTLPRWVDGAHFPALGTLGRGAYRFGLQLGLTPRWRQELEELAAHAHTCLSSFLGVAGGPMEPRAPGLTEIEQALVVEAATRGDTAACIAFLRQLAGNARIEDMASAIELYAQRVQLNRTAMRTFLAARVPSILANHYFPILGTARFNRFIEWSVTHEGWGEALREGALDGGPALRAAVDRTLAAIGS